MWKKQLLTDLIFFAFFNAYNAADESCCIEVEPAENFDADKYSRQWFVFAIEDDVLSSYSCVQFVIYKRQDDDTIPSIRIYEEESDNSRHMLLKNGKINELGRGETFDGYKHTVVAANYEKWAVVIACDEKANKRIVWVLTTIPKPKFTDLIPARNVLKKHGIQLTDLSTVNQENCPADWSDAEKEEVDFKYDDVKDDLKMRGIVKE